jgi:hypothetical protein
MKFEKRTIVVIIVAILFLIWYLIHPILEGAVSASSAETKLQIISNSLASDKIKNPTTDPVILGEKLNLLTQRRDLLNEILKDPKFGAPKSQKIKDSKAAYEKLLQETNTAIPLVTTEKNNAQKALDNSRKKKR